MGIQDSVPERRNLIVMSLAIIVYYWAGGCTGDEVRLLLMNVKFNKPMVLFIFAWVLFIYFIFRYRVTSKTFNGDSIRYKIHHELLAFPIKKKYCPYLLEELRKVVPEGNITGLEFDTWALMYHDNKIEFYAVKNGSGRSMDVKGFRKRWIVFKTLVRGYFNLPNVNAYYTPYILAYVAFFTLGYNTYLKIFTEMLKKSC